MIVNENGINSLFRIFIKYVLLFNNVYVNVRVHLESNGSYNWLVDIRYSFSVNAGVRKMYSQFTQSQIMLSVSITNIHYNIDHQMQNNIRENEAPDRQTME